MSVSVENHRRRSDYETDAPFGRSNARRNHSNGRPVKPRGREEGPLWGFSYDRAESAIHLLLAFIMVGGLAGLLWNFVAPEATKPAAPVKSAALPAPAPAVPAQPQPSPRSPLAAPAMQKVESVKPAEPVAAPALQKIENVKPAEPVAAPAKPEPLAAALMSHTPIANAPAPLPPPPAELREKLAAPAETAPATEAVKPHLVEPIPVRSETEAASAGGVGEGGAQSGARRGEQRQDRPLLSQALGSGADERDLPRRDHRQRHHFPATGQAARNHA